MKIYLAGPEVFLSNSMEVGQQLKDLCQKYGHEGLYPKDKIITGDTLHELANNIRKANVDMIQRADIIIANVTPFRGTEPDSGTMWEIGYAEGIGKRVLAYSTDLRELKIRTQETLGMSNNDMIDSNDMAIEDFELPYNLMFSHLVVENNFEGCLKIINNI